jgi:L-alanine-DL-glutamate epimerase-like enolase superfamily enzyme
VRRAADLGCADVIKLKLMKMGGLERLIEGLALIRSLGMKAVLGNGVATDLGCWMEACVAAAGHVSTDGEMNGFLRARDRLLAPVLETEGAEVALDGASRSPDPAALARLSVAQARFAA